MDKVNAELVTLTYGTIVAQLCKDFEGDYLEVNRQLDKMGYNIGMRLVEDFLAKANSPACANFRETAETISKVGCGRISIRVDISLTAGLVDWFQNLSERHAYGHKLD